MTIDNFMAGSHKNVGAGGYAVELETDDRPVRLGRVFIAVAVVALALWLLPHRASIPPRVESDYCYQLIAADRLYDGRGLTSLQPVAPRQPWTWAYDFGFLTQWPPGYSLMVAGLRFATGAATMEVCQWISIFASAAALVGWFVLIRRSVPGGVPASLLAAVGAGCAVSFTSFVNPSTDALIVAVLPYVLLFVTRALAVQRKRNGGIPTYLGTRSHEGGRVTGDEGAQPFVSTPRAQTPSCLCRFAALGFVSGALFWIRYAAVFVPCAGALFLFIEWFRRCRCHFGRCVFAFVVASLLPIVTLLWINRIYGPPVALHTQLNLGERVGFGDWLGPLAAAWWQFTDLGYYGYQAWAHWLYALWPAFMLAAAMAVPPVRRSLGKIITSPPILLGAVLVGVLLAMLVGATVVFGNKFRYVHLDRYYLPVRPFYFLLFAAPVLWIRQRWVRWASAVLLSLAGVWTLQHEWGSDYMRSRRSLAEVTAYGQRATCFTPGAGALYTWLGTLDSDAVIFSNFHDYITLETGRPAYPIPPDPAALVQCVGDIVSNRGIEEPRVLLVLDPDNRWRSYFLPPLSEVLARFQLTNRVEIPGSPAVAVYEASE